MCIVLAGYRTGLCLVFTTNVPSIVLCELIVRVCVVQHFKDPVIYGNPEGSILKQVKFGIGHSSS